MNVAGLLGSIALCKDLDRRERDVLATVLTRRNFPAGTELFRQGRHASRCHLHVSGRIGLYRDLPDGQRVRLALIKPGGIVGELALFDTGPHAVTAIAEITSVTTLELMRDDFERLVHAESRFAQIVTDAIVRDMSRRLRRSTRRLLHVQADPSRDPTGVRLQHAANDAAALLMTNPALVVDETLDLAGLGGTPSPGRQT